MKLNNQKHVFLSLIGMGLLGCCLLIALRYVFIVSVTQKAESIIAEADKQDFQTEDEKIKAITTAIYSNFKKRDTKQVPLLQLQDLFIRTRLPDFPSGVVETYVSEGLCDTAARALSFVLAQDGYVSVPLHMIAKEKGGHTALLVTMSDGRKILADPFFGYVSVNAQKKLESPYKVQEEMRKGVPLEQAFEKLGPEAYTNYYNDFPNIQLTAEGEDMLLTSSLPKIEGNSALYIGQLDGNDIDTKEASEDYAMSSYWHYVGNRYDSKFVRTLKAVQPVKIVMTLLSKPTDAIMTSTPEAKIEGNSLVWELKEGESITFRDGMAKSSFLNHTSYIGVDQIAVYPL